MLKGGTASLLTAMEQPLSEDQTTKPANSGIAETLTPLPMSASVTLKSGASKASWANTPAATARVPDMIFPKSLMVFEDKWLWNQVDDEAHPPFYSQQLSANVSSCTSK